jgi:hypothetical protein
LLQRFRNAFTRTRRAHGNKVHAQALQTNAEVDAPVFTLKRKRRVPYRLPQKHPLDPPCKHRLRRTPFE